MKKVITLVMTLMTLVLSATAQTETTRTIHGAVIDKNGNPLPGAVVASEGGAETTIAESDGTFSLEVPIWLNKVSASYAGYNKKILKTKFDRDMIFQLRKFAPAPGGYFINVVGGAVIPYDVEYTGANMYIGVRGGHLANWGWYVEAGYDALDKGVQIIAGGIRRIYGPAFAYIGIGYGKATDYSYHSDWNGSDWTESTESYDAMAFDLGFTFLLSRHFDLSLGLTCTTDFYIKSDWGIDFTPKISVGYVF